LRRADGEYRWVFGRGVPRLEGDGTFAGLVGSCVDVTDTRRAREVLEQTRDQLAELVAQRTAELAKSNAKLRAQSRYLGRIEGGARRRSPACGGSPTFAPRARARPGAGRPGAAPARCCSWKGRRTCASS